MSDLQIAWMELILVGGLGVILTLSGIIINIVIKRQVNLCTKQTKGGVVQYRFTREGKMKPVLEYIVDGTCYKTSKKFRGIMIKRISGLSVNEHPEAYEDEKGWLHVKIGSMANLRQLAEQFSQRRIPAFNIS